jgi:hypothetical protein
MSGRKGHGRHIRRIPEGERYQLPCFQKVWKKCFLTHHDLPGKDDIAAVEAKRSLGCVEDELTSFLDISDGSGSPCEADEVKWYCEGRTSLEKVQRGIGEAATIVAVWIDDRNSPHLNGAGRVRLCQKLLTPHGLYRYLQQPVWSLSDLLSFGPLLTCYLSATNTIMKQMQSEGLCEKSTHSTSCTRNSLGVVTSQT